MIDYHSDIAPTQHRLKVLRCLHDGTVYSKYSHGDFECEYGDRKVFVDLMSGSSFPDDFDYSSLVGETVNVDHTHGYMFIATDATIVGRES